MHTRLDIVGIVMASACSVFASGRRIGSAGGSGVSAGEEGNRSRGVELGAETKGNVKKAVYILTVGDPRFLGVRPVSCTRPKLTNGSCIWV
jgi:hypothetical protein